MTTSLASTPQPTVWQDATPEAQVDDIIRKPFCPIARIVAKEILADGRTCLLVTFPGCRDHSKEEWVLPAVEVVPAPTPASKTMPSEQTAHNQVEETLQAKTISNNFTDLKLVRRNAFRKQCRALNSITSATVNSKITNYKTQPFFDFPQIKAAYDQHPNARLYQASEWIYVLFVGTGDTVYRFAINHQPLSIKFAKSNNVIPATSETDQQPPGRGDGRGRVQPIAQTDKKLAAAFKDRSKQYQQFLIIREELAAIGVKVGKLINSRSDAKGWRLDWDGDKAGLFWTVGDGWDIEALKSGDELTGQWEDFTLEQFLECNGIDLDPEDE